MNMFFLLMKEKKNRKNGRPKYMCAPIPELNRPKTKDATFCTTNAHFVIRAISVNHSELGFQVEHKTDCLRIQFKGGHFAMCPLV